MNKEEIYDAHISPLMTQIVAICKEHKIGMVASYAIPTEEDDGLHCSTHLPDETGKLPERINRMVKALGLHAPSPMMLRTQHADGSQTLSAIMP